MLRICYCLSHYHPVASGAERQAHRQAVELVRRGHSVRVITRATPGCDAQERLDGVVIHRAIRPRELGPLFGVSFVTTLGAALWRLRGEFDLVHCHQALWEAVSAGALVGPVLAKPTVVQPAAGGPYGEAQELARTRGRGLLRGLILRNRHFVAISQEIEREWLDLGVPPERLTRIGSGVDTDSFRPGASPLREPLPPAPRVLFLGRLHAQKNLDTLLEAWPAVRRQVPASLLIAGDGPAADRLRARARSLDTDRSIHFLGAVSDPLAYLRAADVFVLPSRAEGMSNALLEAMAVALPVVVSRIGGNIDLVKQAETGLLVDPGDVVGWSAALVRVLGDPAARQRWGAAARQFVCARYAMAAVIDRYVALYEKLLVCT